MVRKVTVILLPFLVIGIISLYKIHSTITSCSTVLPCLDLVRRYPFLVPKKYQTLLPHLNYLLGFEKPINYFILLQNDTEIRANGGFTGSYAVFNVDKGDFTYRFQDIYVPDGQITNHITPPDAIQAAFKHGTWYTANFDYEPDFPTSAAAFIWFMKEGKEETPDNVLTLNLSAIKKVLKITGSINLPDYNIIINSDNLANLLQTEVETNFFPGSTKKKDILTSLGKRFLDHVFSLPLPKKLSILNLILTDFNRQNSLFYSSNAPVQNSLSYLGWTGSFAPVSSDTYALIELNLGANKANCCVLRNTTHVISQNTPSEASGEVGSITHQVTVNFTNNSPSENPTPPTFFGGNYIAFLRFYIPDNATNIKVDNPDFTLDKNFGFTQVGLFHTTKSLTTTQINLSYNIPKDNYALTILKQHGLETSPQTIDFFGKILSTPLETSFGI